MVATLPAGDVFDEVLALVADGSTAETSVEFRALEQTIRGDRRTIRAAALPAIGIVDAGAYGSAGAVEVRRDGRGVAGRVAYDTPRVTADRGTRRKQRFAPGAFDYALNQADREIILQIGDDAGQVLGSKRAGTLALRDTPEALEFEVETLPATSYAADFLELLAAGTILPGVLALFRIPPADVVPDAVSIEADPDNPEVEVEVIRSALLTALSIRYRAPRYDGDGSSVEARSAGGKGVGGRNPDPGRDRASMRPPVDRTGASVPRRRRIWL